MESCSIPPGYSLPAPGLKEQILSFSGCRVSLTFCAHFTVQFHRPPEVLCWKASPQPDDATTMLWPGHTKAVRIWFHDTLFEKSRSAFTQSRWHVPSMFTLYLHYQKKGFSSLGNILKTFKKLLKYTYEQYINTDIIADTVGKCYYLQ